jgi:hypothetical protein
VRKAGNDLVQELTELRVEALIMEVDQKVSCGMANVKGAHALASCAQTIESATK